MIELEVDTTLINDFEDRGYSFKIQLNPKITNQTLIT